MSDQSTEARLRAALQETMEFWVLVYDQLNQSDDQAGRVRFMEFHRPITRIQVALSATPDKLSDKEIAREAAATFTNSDDSREELAEIIVAAIQAARNAPSVPPTPKSNE